MTKIINTIKKSFVYIVGFLFFIIAMYVMLVPPNSKLNNNKTGLVEAFTGDPNYMTATYNNNIPITKTNMDSITAYRNIIGQKLNNISIFDSYIKNNITIIPDINKSLVLSRCYQMPFNSDLIKRNNNTNSYNNIFGSYAERYDYKNNNDFGDIITTHIKPSILTFIKTLTNQAITNDNSEVSKNTESNKNIEIDGDVYVLILQYPLFKDNSTNTEIDLTITSSILPQSRNNANANLIYYSPSYIAPISNSAKSTNQIKTNTPINYTIFIIYDNYANGPNSPFGDITKIKNNRFSDIKKKKLDETALSTAEQCFIGGMGTGGLDYIGGCASLGGVGPTKFPFCGSQIPGDQAPWSYLVLYNVNKQVLAQSSSALG